MVSKWIYLSLLLLFSCKEFYDEEFTEGGNVIVKNKDANYQVTLSPTDASLTEITGDAQVILNGDEVTVTVNMTGVPENINQLHYGLSPVACSALTITVPAELGTSRSYTINESLSRRALDFDLQSGGLSSNELAGKSFIIKAFSSLTTTVPGNSGSYIIACGTIDESGQVTIEGPEDGTNEN